ncbi:unnamed protein product [Diatraea saccharalis]|uniref:PHD-type domain-containing protein n=1 Tax=Diatraea saccharalis TaxID=40085 RepID=A0A9N9QZN0_9NEOP|nr:unnamed protein product [Diatraea saccharalis]
MPEPVADNLPVPANNPQYLHKSNYVASNVEIETSPSILQPLPRQSDCSVDYISEPGPSDIQLADNNREDKSTAIFSPELIRPLPKAPPRLIGYNKRRKRKTTVLTDTPEKNALAEKQANKKKRKTLLREEFLQDDSSDDEDDEEELYCIICCDAYSNSTPGEKWIECGECKNWAHLQCIEDEESVAFICPYCYSDQSDQL